MGLPRFERGSREPKSPSLDQASRQPLLSSLGVIAHRKEDNFGCIIKTLAKLQYLSKVNQKTIWYSLTHLNKYVDLCCQKLAWYYSCLDLLCFMLISNVPCSSYRIHFSSQNLLYLRFISNFSVGGGASGGL